MTEYNLNGALISLSDLWLEILISNDNEHFNIMKLYIPVALPNLCLQCSYMEKVVKVKEVILLSDCLIPRPHCNTNAAFKL